jgi:NAD(P)-dependent dehydrogenase (short-subunit alcohol dehydrogenase family)
MHHFPYYNDDKNDLDVSSIEYWRVAIEPKRDGNDDSSSVRKTYGPSKLAAVLFSIELNRRYGESMGIRSLAVNPGAV